MALLRSQVTNDPQSASAPPDRQGALSKPIDALAEAEAKLIEHNAATAQPYRALSHAQVRSQELSARGDVDRSLAIDPQVKRLKMEIETREYRGSVLAASVTQARTAAWEAERAHVGSQLAEGRTELCRAAAYLTSAIDQLRHVEVAAEELGLVAESDKTPPADVTTGSLLRSWTRAYLERTSLLQPEPSRITVNANSTRTPCA